MGWRGVSGVAALVLLWGCASQKAALQLQVEGVPVQRSGGSCAGCVQDIANSLEELDSVCQATHDSGSDVFSLVLRSWEEASLSEIRGAIKGEGQQGGRSYRVIWADPPQGGGPASELHLKGRLPTLDDASLQWEDVVGNRPVVVAFWATWCGPCIDELVFLQHFHQTYGNEIAFVSVSIDDPEDYPILKRFVERQKITYPVALDPEGVFLESQGVQALPFTVVLDAKGRTLYRHHRYREKDMPLLEDAIVRAIESEAKAPAE
ncbi:MAG: TlpA disulfide reductase family protein [Myxococcota bacterium]|nr:TlpA disulfide reductase family protein [Myxococcota bacterium]